MSLILFALIVILILALAIWAIRLLPVPQPVNNILQVLAIVLAILAIGHRAGLF